LKEHTLAVGEKTANPTHETLKSARGPDFQSSFASAAMHPTERRHSFAVTFALLHNRLSGIWWRLSAFGQMPEMPHIIQSCRFDTQFRSMRRHSSAELRFFLAMVKLAAVRIWLREIESTT
jgi:hypothetical protein